MKIHNIFSLPNDTVLDQYLDWDFEPPELPKLEKAPVAVLEFGHGDYWVRGRERYGPDGKLEDRSLTSHEEALIKANGGYNLGPQLYDGAKQLQLSEVWLVRSEDDTVVLLFDHNPKDMFAPDKLVGVNRLSRSPAEQD
jgi:hypothetical protein